MFEDGVAGGNYRLVQIRLFLFIRSPSSYAHFRHGDARSIRACHLAIRRYAARHYRRIAGRVVRVAQDRQQFFHGRLDRLLDECRLTCLRRIRIPFLVAKLDYRDQFCYFVGWYRVPTSPFFGIVAASFVRVTLVGVTGIGVYEGVAGRGETSKSDCTRWIVVVALSILLLVFSCASASRALLLSSCSRCAHLAGYPQFCA